MGFLKAAAKKAVTAVAEAMVSCSVCGKSMKKPRNARGSEGFVCSVACAHFWGESM
jgi:hypothetical protein